MAKSLLTTHCEGYRRPLVAPHQGAATLGDRPFRQEAGVATAPPLTLRPRAASRAVPLTGPASRGRGRRRGRPSVVGLVIAAAIPPPDVMKRPDPRH